MMVWQRHIKSAQIDHWKRHYCIPENMINTTLAVYKGECRDHKYHQEIKNGNQKYIPVGDVWDTVNNEKKGP